MATRTGWLQEPNCQSCHTGTATHNNGEIRYTSAFAAPGQARVAVDQTFATNADKPAAGLSLYRFSKGHGGLICEACHGSTHAEFTSIHDNDNVQSQERQGHKGMLVELLQRARTSGATTSLDLTFPDPSSDSGRADWRAILEATLPFVDLFLPSVEELLFMLRREQNDALQKASPDGNVLNGLTPELLSSLGGELIEMGQLRLDGEDGARFFFARVTIHGCFPLGFDGGVILR